MFEFSDEEAEIALVKSSIEEPGANWDESEGVDYVLAAGYLIDHWLKSTYDWADHNKLQCQYIHTALALSDKRRASEKRELNALKLMLLSALVGVVALVAMVILSSSAKTSTILEIATGIFTVAAMSAIISNSIFREAGDDVITYYKFFSTQFM